MPDLRAGVKFGTAVGALGSLGIILIAAAQTLSPGEVRISSHSYQPRTNVLRAESRVVQIEVVVRDGRGRPLAGLTRDDFAVFDSGKRRDLTLFSVERHKEAVATRRKTAIVPPVTAIQPATPAPKPEGQNPAIGRWIALFLDDVNTFPGDLAHAKIAASRFIREATGSGDRIALFTTSGGEILDFTTESPNVIATVKNVEFHPRISPGGLSSCPRMTAYEAYRIVSNDPSALRAKVDEACHCSGGQTCDLSDIPPGELLTPTTRGGGSPYGGSGVLSNTIVSVQEQAQATWSQTRSVSEATLNAIGASLDHLARMPGKRILFLASSGFLSGDLVAEQDTIINEALHADVVINSLDAKGLYAEGPARPLNEIVETTDFPVDTQVFEIQSLGDRLDSADAAMARFAESTGGLLFRNNNDLDFGFYELGVAPAYAYELGFPTAEDGKYHKIKVKLKNASGDFIQARPGYFAPTKASSEPTAEEKLDAEMRATDEKTGFPVAVSDTLNTTTAGARRLTIQARVDIRDLPFERQKDRHVEKLTFVAALFDQKGNFITGKQADMDLTLKPASFERFSKMGISGTMSLEAPPGAYRLRVVVQEAVHGNLAAVTKDVQI